MHTLHPCLEKASNVFLICEYWNYFLSPREAFAACSLQTDHEILAHSKMHAACINNKRFSLVYESKFNHKNNGIEVALTSAFQFWMLPQSKLKWFDCHKLGEYITQGRITRKIRNRMFTTERWTTRPKNSWQQPITRKDEIEDVLESWVPFPSFPYLWRWFYIWRISWHISVPF